MDDLWRGEQLREALLVKIPVSACCVCSRPSSGDSVSDYFIWLGVRNRITEMFSVSSHFSPPGMVHIKKDS